MQMLLRSRGAARRTLATLSQMQITSMQPGHHITGFDDRAFVVNKSLTLHGSCLVFPDLTLLWRAHLGCEITPELCTVFTLYRPKIDLVIFGTGETPRALPEETRRYLLKNGIFFEAMTTFSAIGTYNALYDEGRNVCAALLTEVPSHETLEGSQRHRLVRELAL